ncbi:hypothetical protein SRABI106_04856 [Rahnella aquatilis]|nr:hypothetical protein SRABI106_04856 [Rahnella aquatilis]
MLLVLLLQCVRQQLDTLFIALADVVNKAPFEAHPYAPVHGDQHQRAGTKDGHKQLGSDTRFHDFLIGSGEPASARRRLMMAFFCVSGGTLENTQAGRAITSAIDM